MKLNKQMCLNLNSYNMTNDDKYRALCKLYSKYKNAIKIAVDNKYNDKLSENKMFELDAVLQDVERYPIQWKYYKNQPIQFSSDFENLIIFSDR